MANKMKFSIHYTRCKSSDNQRGESKPQRGKTKIPEF